LSSGRPPALEWPLALVVEPLGWVSTGRTGAASLVSGELLPATAPRPEGSVGWTSREAPAQAAPSPSGVLSLRCPANAHG